jgi:hypothetical protein
MKLNEKQKVIVTAAVFLLVLAGVGALNYFKFQERGRLRADMQRYQREEQAAREKRKRIPELVEQRAKLIEQIDRYTEILPPEKHVQHEAFVRTMDEYRRDTKLLIKTAEYVPVKQDPNEREQQNFVRHRYKFKLVGTVPDFLDFIAKVENHRRFLKIDAINISPFGVTGEFTEGDLGDRNDRELLEKAKGELKEIDLTVSTYTYVKGSQNT